MVKIGVLISGGGTNLQAVIDGCENKSINGEVKVVISNKEEAYGLERARNHKITAICEKDENKIIVFHEICTALCIIGIVLSLIWIMMAKGSKAWYELYENAICSIEREKTIDIPESYKMGNIYSERPIDNNIFTNNAGCYSPSKLNIIIGRLFLIIWNTIYIIHLVFEIIWIKNSNTTHIETIVTTF